MNAVGKLGNYISRGVVTVSAPFHPFGGAVDIVVVEQRDGTFKSSPWYVQFGKFQGILKARGKVVSINVNGVDADLRMYLDNRGGAHFLKEVDGDEGMSESICSSNQSDASSFVRGFQKCNSCNDELKRPKKKMNRSCTTGPRVLGFELGRRSWKEKRLQKQETADGRDRENSLERAEIAADLLEIRWSTSLATAKHRKNIAQLNSESNSFHGKGDPEFETAANYMESFIMKETYLDFNVYGSSVGDSGTNSNSFKSAADEIFSGDEQSVSPQSLQSGDERRMIRDESSISCVTSESLTSRFDGSSGGSSDNLCDVEHGMISTVNSDLSSCTSAGELVMNTENLEDKDPCISVDGLKYNNSTVRDVKSELELDVDLVVESKTIGSPVNYVDEMVANKIPSVSRSIFDSKENSSSEIVSSFASADLLHTSSCEKTDGEQNMSVDLDYSVKRKNVSMDDISSDSAVEESSSQSSASIKKKIVWVKTPTSEQLASLNLKRGRNEVTFTFFTPVLGDQKIDARIHLWKWDTRIVISDVDGTITKSDVLGQFMPLVGVDWSQTGVAHLFSAIKENGYELLFLSARAISQASLTRQFLFNLKQDGKALPEGPVVISPDGLLPSLIREVIRRAPHEFKIACLETIRDLFPPDHNPFYAGFGNRDTDELSYLKVGVPKGKIFIINPKGEVAVQRRVDRKSYTSLHTIVHDMFPPPSTISSSEQEDFNSWNFWRLPHPEIVV